MLDLKEAAQEGMGPHGLCVGATGSGKSELLRTLVLGLAVTHSSETLNFVLADFKGGATFAGMAQMPHVAAVITNLADDLTLVDRMGDSIRGELNRRQEMLRDAGNYANIHDYEKARAAGAPLQPIPSLVLVIDEFSELLTAKPDFIEMFVQIGRIGRSLGVHLLLASQRLRRVACGAWRPDLSYLIGLRTFSAAESRAAIGVPDAYELPNVPGSGLLKFGTEEMVRFKAAYVSGVYRTSSQQSAAPGGPLPADRRPVLFTAAEVPVQYSPIPQQRQAEPDEQKDDALADTVLDVIVRRLEAQGPAAHQALDPPPLDSPPSLNSLLPGLAPVQGRGMTQPGYEGAGRLVIPVGLIDKPYEQRRDPLWADFGGAAGHMQLLGGPQSGKSTLLRSIVASFALTHTPHEVQFYGLDFGGGGLSSVAGLPHVGGVASRLDPEKVRRTAAEVYGILTRREEYFRSAGISSIAEFRTRRARGDISVTDQPWGDVFLVIDGWGNFRQDYEALEPLVDIAARGLGYGIRGGGEGGGGGGRSSTARSRPTCPRACRDAVRRRRSSTSWRRSRASTACPPTRTWRRCAQALAAEVSRHWQQPGAPEVRLLPREFPASQLPPGDRFPNRGVSFGLDEDNLEPVFVDFDQDPFLLVFGESESGKSNLLKLLIKRITERYDGNSSQAVRGRQPPFAAGCHPAFPPGGVHPHVEPDAAPHGRPGRPDAAPHAHRGRHGGAAARPQLVAWPHGVRDRRRLRPGVHVERQPAGGPDGSPPVRP
ncbi:Type VII secretion protein EccCa OS=Streptomyces alboniger OX=132473 GN=eccCa PE=4 SV=1 [Streptomyces alboniger]